MTFVLQIGERSLEPKRVFCIGRNYEDHIKELGGAGLNKNDKPGTPVLFMKPASCLHPLGEPIARPPYGDVLHHEVELVLIIGKGGSRIKAAQAREHIAGITIGIDLTLRDVQSQLKEKGLPWERAKAFDHSAPVGEVVVLTDEIDLSNLQIRCAVNGAIRQDDNTTSMIFTPEVLVSSISDAWKLLPGDVIFTGTPAGVGPLEVGDEITIDCPAIGSFSWEIIGPQI
ncbi:fumarylacetoacetate hydrolase family protein [Planctomycetota bacterium]